MHGAGRRDLEPDLDGYPEAVVTDDPDAATVSTGLDGGDGALTRVSHALLPAVFPGGGLSPATIVDVQRDGFPGTLLGGTGNGCTDPVVLLEPDGPAFRFIAPGRYPQSPVSRYRPTSR